MSANHMKHQSKLARLSHGMCNLANEVVQWHKSSAKDSTHKHGMFLSCNWPRPMTCDINQACMQEHAICVCCKRRRPTTCSISKGQHKSIVSCACWLGNLSGVLSAYIRGHHMRPVRIAKATSPNERKQQQRPKHISRGVCATTHGHQSYTTETTINLVFTHLTWFVCMFQTTSDNEMKYHPRHIHITYRVCATTKRHWYQPTISTINKDLCPLSKWRWPMIGSIS